MNDQIHRIGFIGAGNMGSAIISRLARQIPEKIIAFDTDTDKTRALKEQWGITIAESAAEVCSSDVAVMAVKPDALAQLLKDIRHDLGSETIVVSIAAGVSIATIEEILGRDRKIFRVMPNTPAMAGEGMAVIAENAAAARGGRDIVEFLFTRVGRVTHMPEKSLDAVTGLSGSGPAFVFTFIQALADGGVKMGLPRDSALTLAAQTVLGSAKLVLDSGRDPITLRSSVASPGGTTIEGIHVLEKAGFAGIVMDAVEAATNKSRKLGEK
jgi:pyrroline-5-carboxylate reductase